MRAKSNAYKILVLGAKGMLGSMLCNILSDQAPIAWDREDLDICNEDEVRIKISRLKPTIIINAAAYTDVDGAENNKDEAFRVNADAVGYLANVSSKLGITFVHYSTDYVFSGTNPLGYKEDYGSATGGSEGGLLSRRSLDEGGPVNVYGLSKLKGEEILQENLKNNNAKWYIIRTSWLYGPGGNNFVKTIYNLAKEKEELKVVSDQYGKPTYTEDLARATKKLINKNYAFGIYHFTNHTPDSGITRFEFAKEIIQLSNLSVNVLPASAAFLRRAAKRPKFSLLINSKFPKLPGWKFSLDEYLRKYLLLGKHQYIYNF